MSTYIEPRHPGILWLAFELGPSHAACRCRRLSITSPSLGGTWWTCCLLGVTVMSSCSLRFAICRCSPRKDISTHSHTHTHVTWQFVESSNPIANNVRSKHLFDRSRGDFFRRLSSLRPTEELHMALEVPLLMVHVTNWDDVSGVCILSNFVL